jgi:hypothetical protein
MSLEICQRLEKLDHRETRLVLCYRFPDCLAVAGDPARDCA